jgi:hypothetical protein
MAIKSGVDWRGGFHLRRVPTSLMIPDASAEHDIDVLLEPPGELPRRQPTMHLSQGMGNN